jgi:hypothetical protein
MEFECILFSVLSCCADDVGGTFACALSLYILELCFLNIRNMIATGDVNPSWSLVPVKKIFVVSSGLHLHSGKKGGDCFICTSFSASCRLAVRTDQMHISSQHSDIRSSVVSLNPRPPKQ